MLEQRRAADKHAIELTEVVRFCWLDASLREGVDECRYHSRRADLLLCDHVEKGRGRRKRGRSFVEQNGRLPGKRRQHGVPDHPARRGMKESDLAALEIGLK